MITVFLILVVLAGLAVIGAVLREPRVPLWIAVALLWFIELLRQLPLGR